MTRNLKALGLALIAVFALSAVGAGAASAAEFHSTSASTKITAVQTNIHKFTSTAGEITCEKATFTATQATPTTKSVTLAPKYEGCHIIFFGSTIQATLAMTGCTYTLNSETGHEDLKCPEGIAGAHITGAGCKITIPPQTTLKSVTYANSGSGITITANLSGIKYIHEGFTCGTGSGTTGTYKGTTLATGTDTAGKAVTISYS